MPDIATGRREKIITFGILQNAAGVVTHHMHPEGEVFEDIGGQKAGEPCVWCVRGVPRLGAVSRVVEDGLVTLTDVATGDQLMPPYRLED